MYTSTILNVNPRNNYKAKKWFGKIYVMDMKTHKVIYSCKKPKPKNGITKSVDPESPRDIFYEIGLPSSYKYFSHGTEISGLEMDDKYAEIIKSSGVMELNQYLLHMENMEEIVKQTKRFDLGSRDKMHMFSFYFDKFIEGKESLKKFKKWLRKKMKDYDNRSTLEKFKYLFLLNKNSV
jgi:hypothetical protein